MGKYWLLESSGLTIKKGQKQMTKVDGPKNFPKKNTSPFDQVLPNEKNFEQPPLDTPFNFDKINA